MKTKFSSYKEIDRELQILRLEREIHLHKISKSANDVKNTFAPKNLLNSIFSSSLIGSSKLGSFGSSGIKTILLTSALKFVLNRIFKKKK